MNVFSWMNDQFLRMDWLDDLVRAGITSLGLDPASRICGSVQFFVCDVIKIFILLSVLIFAISYDPALLPRSNAPLRHDSEGTRQELHAQIHPALT